MYNASLTLKCYKFKKNLNVMFHFIYRKRREGHTFNIQRQAATCGLHKTSELWEISARCVPRSRIFRCSGKWQEVSVYALSIFCQLPSLSATPFHSLLETWAWNSKISSQWDESHVHVQGTHLGYAHGVRIIQCKLFDKISSRLSKSLMK